MPGRVLGDLGERHVGVDHDQPGRLQVGLEPPQPPQVGAEGHEAEVGLVAEHGHRHHLDPVGLGVLDRLDDGLGVAARGPSGPGRGRPAWRTGGARPTRPRGRGVRSRPSVYGTGRRAPRRAPFVSRLVRRRHDDGGRSGRGGRLRSRPCPRPAWPHPTPRACRR